MSEDTPEATTRPGPVVEIAGDPVAVYRFYDTLGRLLYVGISSNLASRWGAHAKTQPWWRQVARKTVVIYGSREEAATAEDRAILDEHPIHNVVSREPRPQPRKPPKRAQPLPASTLPGPRTFEPGADFAALIDAFAEKRKVSRGTAIGQLAYSGLVRDFALENGTMEDLDVEAAAMVAYKKGGRGATVSLIRGT